MIWRRINLLNTVFYCKLEIEFSIFYGSSRITKPVKCHRLYHVLIPLICLSIPDNIFNT